MGKGAKPTSSDLASLSHEQVGSLLYRFFEWWIVMSRPGDPAIGGRAVSIHQVFPFSTATRVAGCVCKAGKQHQPHITSWCHCCCCSATRAS